MASGSSAWQERFGDLKNWSTSCPICKGTSFLALSTDRVFAPFRDEADQRCPCYYLFLSMQALWVGSYPKDYLTLNYDSSYPASQLPSAIEAVWDLRFPDSHAWLMAPEDEAALAYWVDNADAVATKGLSLVLYGDKGTGKSALATTLSKEFVKRRGIDACNLRSDFSVRWLVADALYEDLGKGWRSKDAYGPCLNADLLVLDDLRMAYRSAVAAEYLERIHSLLQHRSGNGLPTIITANKIAEGQDHVSNAITEFLGIDSDGVPQRYGKYRFVRLTNTALRPASEWGC